MVDLELFLEALEVHHVEARVKHALFGQFGVLVVVDESVEPNFGKIAEVCF
jgi:hypothetical protein